MTSIREDGSSVRHYLGYVRVAEPPTAGHGEEFKVSDVKTIGIRMSQGFGIGYFHDHNERIPLDCRLVIKVANKQQLDEVIEQLTPITKEGLCVAVSKK